MGTVAILARVIGGLLLGTVLGLAVGALAVLALLRAVGRLTGAVRPRAVLEVVLDGLWSRPHRDGMAAQRVLARRLKHTGSRTASGGTVAATRLDLHVSPEDFELIEGAMGLPEAERDLAAFYADGEGLDVDGIAGAARAAALALRLLDPAAPGYAVAVSDLDGLLARLGLDYAGEGRISVDGGPGLRHGSDLVYGPRVSAARVELGAGRHDLFREQAPHPAGDALDADAEGHAASPFRCGRSGGGRPLAALLP